LRHPYLRLSVVSLRSNSIQRENRTVCEAGEAFSLRKLESNSREVGRTQDFSAGGQARKSEMCGLRRNYLAKARRRTAVLQSCTIRSPSARRPLAVRPHLHSTRARKPAVRQAMMELTRRTLVQAQPEQGPIAGQQAEEPIDSKFQALPTLLRAALLPQITFFFLPRLSPIIF
jgi:hypothetical protein